MTKQNLSNFIISLALILAGGFFLAQNLGYLTMPAPQMWPWLLGGLSAVFLIAYISSGLRGWWWLFPTLILGEAAIRLSMDSSGFATALLGVPMLLGVAVPFFAAFAIDRQKNWWALIPGTILGVTSVMPLLESRVAGEVIGSIVVFSVALPFLLIFLFNTTRRWALIPAMVLGFIGLIPLVTLLGNEKFVPVLVMLVFAVPFGLVFAAERRAWWALIPSGVFASIGAGVLVDALAGTVGGAAVPGVMFLGWSLTFAVLWLLRGRYPTAWARFPAIGCAAMALLLMVIAPVTRFIWPFTLIGIGGYVLYRALRPAKAN
jgi:hypothetical protein